MRKRFTFLIAAIAAILLITQPMKVMGQTKTTTTYRHVFSTKPSTGNGITLDSVNWNISATNLNGYQSSYAGVQIGTKSAAGNITLTSSSNWGAQSGTYYGKTKITEVRLWLNNGTGTIDTYTVTIGGKTATASGTIVKNSSATTYEDASQITYTPAEDGYSGQVVINVATSSKAGYICCVEIDCEEPSLSINASPVSPLAYNATNGSISYSLSGAPSEATVSASVPDGSWLTIDNANITTTSVPFTMSQNIAGPKRTVTVTLSYEGADDKQVVITQNEDPDYVFGGNVTITFSELGMDNAENFEEYTTDDGYITITGAQGTNDASTPLVPKYYTSGSAVRFYYGNTFTVSTKDNTRLAITKIEFSLASTNGISVDCGNFVDNGESGTWYGVNAPVVFSIDGSSGQRRISSVTIYYAKKISEAQDDLNINSPYAIASGSTVTGTLSCNDAANLVIADGGQLKTTSDNVKATVYKNIAAWTTDPVGNWCFIASPLVGNTDPTDVENMVTPKNGDNYTFDLYRYNDAAANNLAWENYNNTTHTDGFNLVNGQGYLYANVATQTLGFVGVIKPYITTEDANKVAIGPGFNLIGNPFTFSTFINKPYYTLNDGGTTILASEVKNVAINPCAGVIVNGGELGDDIYFTDASQNVASTNNGNLQMVLSQTVAARGESNTVTLDNAIVSFNEGSELPKFYFGTQNANIYIPMDNEEFAIVSSNGQGEMPVNFRAYVAGEYTITVNPEEVEMGYLHLIDNIAGKDIDLLATPSYTFNAKADDYESRFRLVFSANSGNEIGNGNEDFAFISNGLLIVNGTGTIQIIDMMGRVISSEMVNGTTSKTIDAKAGVYVLRLINGTDVKTQKIVIR